MKSSWRFVAAGMVSVWIAGIAYAVKPSAQAVIPSPPPGAIAGTFFKNVTTSTLKTLTVDDFIAAMGVMSGALGWDCADCHPGAGTDTVDWVFDTRVKRTARRMVEMVDAINKARFGGAQKVTCWTCDHGRDIPASSIMLDKLYEAPNDELDDLHRAGQGSAAGHADPRQVHRGPWRRPAAERADQLHRDGNQPRLRGIRRHGRLHHLSRNLPANARR